MPDGSTWCKVGSNPAAAARAVVPLTPLVAASEWVGNFYGAECGRNYIGS